MDKRVDKASKAGVAAILDLLDKSRSNQSLAVQALARMLSSPLDQVRRSVVDWPAFTVSVACYSSTL